MTNRYIYREILALFENPSHFSGAVGCSFNNGGEDLVLFVFIAGPSGAQDCATLFLPEAAPSDLPVVSPSPAVRSHGDNIAPAVPG